MGLVLERTIRRSDIEGIGWTAPNHPFFQFVGGRQSVFYGNFDPRIVLPLMRLIGEEIGAPTETPELPFLLKYKRGKG